MYSNKSFEYFVWVLYGNERSEEYIDFTMMFFCLLSRITFSGSRIPPIFIHNSSKDRYWDWDSILVGAFLKYFSLLVKIQKQKSQNFQIASNNLTFLNIFEVSQTYKQNRNQIWQLLSVRKNFENFKFVDFSLTNLI